MVTELMVEDVLLRPSLEQLGEVLDIPGGVPQYLLLGHSPPGVDLLLETRQQRLEGQEAVLEPGCP